MTSFLVSRRRRLIVAFALLVAVVTLASCVDSATSPAASAAPRLAAPPAIDASVGRPMLASSAEAEDPALRDQRDREVQRIAAEKIRSASVYDSLHALWVLTHGKHSLHHQRAASTVAECEPLPYAADVQIVGPAGAMFDVGPHRFYIPRGAIAQPTVITVELPVANHAELDFAPHGLHFGTSYVMLDYHKCDLGTSKSRRVVYTDDAYTILETEASYDQKSASSVWAAINHFSHFVVGY